MRAAEARRYFTLSEGSSRLARNPSDEGLSSVLQRLRPLIRARSAEHNRDGYDCDRE